MLLNSMESIGRLQWALGHPPMVPVSSYTCPFFAAPGGKGWLCLQAQGARWRHLGNTVIAMNDMGEKRHFHLCFCVKSCPLVFNYPLPQIQMLPETGGLAGLCSMCAASGGSSPHRAPLLTAAVKLCWSKRGEVGTNGFVKQLCRQHQDTSALRVTVQALTVSLGAAAQA